tara:strand:+ start:553 stop:1482 length:930 start_codon:yes stop_codon:yes gene_type:complete
MEINQEGNNMDWKDVLKNDVEKGLFSRSKFPNEESEQFYNMQFNNAYNWSGDPYRKKQFQKQVMALPKAQRTVDGIKSVLTAIGSPSKFTLRKPQQQNIVTETVDSIDNVRTEGSDPARNLTSPYKKMLKGSKPMNRWGPIIDEIMSDGYNRTSRGIIESLYNYQNDKKKSTRGIPSQRAISMYLKSNPEYIKMSSSSYGTEYRLKDNVTKLMKGMETATRSAELHAMNDYDLYQSIIGYIKSLVKAGNDKAEVLSMLSQWLPNIMVHNSNFMEELEGYGEIDAISDVEWANVAENFADYIDDFVEDLQ